MELHWIQEQPCQPPQVKGPWFTGDAALADCDNHCNLEQTIVDFGEGRSQTHKALDK
jgi:hypothetical protein